MENNIFITITGTKYYYGMKAFEIGRIIKLVKETNNEYDQEAIRAELPFIDKVGYVANSANTVVKGTFSGGRIYDSFEKEVFAQVLFITHDSVICMLIYEDVDEESTIASGEITDRKAVNTKGKIGFHL